jgi:hypothetical protein
VAFPKSETEIMAIVECAAQHSVRVHPRCGGHGNQGARRSRAALAACLALLGVSLNRTPYTRQPTRAYLGRTAHQVCLELSYPVAAVFLNLTRT